MDYILRLNLPSYKNFAKVVKGVVGLVAAFSKECKCGQKYWNINLEKKSLFKKRAQILSVH